MLTVRNFLLLICVSCALCLPPSARAQTAENRASSHPAAKAVYQYLRHALAREWTKSAALVEKRSLVQLRTDYVARIKRAKTVDEELKMISKLGKKDVREVAAMDPVDFYTAYHTALQQRYQVTPKVLTQISNSLDMRLLSLAQDGPKKVHILVRTQHRDFDNQIENMELISLVLEDGQWRVGLNEQVPKITPLSELPKAVKKAIPLGQ